MHTNVVDLHPRTTRPDDHDTGTPVVLSDLEWSLVVDALRNSPLRAMRDCGDEITTQVRAHQTRRLHPSRKNR